jgi:hypothetical protein
MLFDGGKGDLTIKVWATGKWLCATNGFYMWLWLWLWLLWLKLG